MVSLVDVAPSTRTVPVGGVALPVPGISALGIAALLQQFPGLKDAFTGGTISVSLDAATLMKYGPDAVSAIIAAGCGSPGDPAAIKVAETLPAGDQMNLLAAIIDVTMPQGIASFMEALDSTIAKLNFENLGKDPVTK